MIWTRADQAYNLAKNNHLPYRYHTLAWGSQYPAWIKTLNPSDFQIEMEEFISAVARRYPYIDQIDVINEALPGHQDDTKYFINGLGGAGESGYDWAVWLFKKAREYFPNSKLILNDFGLVNNSSAIREQMLLLKVLRDSALVDGFGAQAHTFNLDYTNATNLKTNLDLMATAGVPIYITEMDMQGINTDEASQLTSYKNLFPVLWEHPALAGITLWGYVYDNMWKPKAGLVYSNNIERQSMVWLKDYMSKQEYLGYPLKGDITSSSDDLFLAYNLDINVYPNPALRDVTIHNNSNRTERIRIYNLVGQVIEDFEINANSKVQLSLSAGMYLVNINNRKTVKLLVNE
jgi:GH35 family endo-1,4-beta-xylanase